MQKDSNCPTFAVNRKTVWSSGDQSVVDCHLARCHNAETCEWERATIYIEATGNVPNKLKAIVGKMVEINNQWDEDDLVPKDMADKLVQSFSADNNAQLVKQTT